jgi:hypothetical protein
MLFLHIQTSNVRAYRSQVCCPCQGLTSRQRFRGQLEKPSTWDQSTSYQNLARSRKGVSCLILSAFLYPNNNLSAKHRWQETVLVSPSLVWYYGKWRTVVWQTFNSQGTNLFVVLFSASSHFPGLSSCAGTYMYLQVVFLSPRILTPLLLSQVWKSYFHLFPLISNTGAYLL